MGFLDFLDILDFLDSLDFLDLLDLLDNLSTGWGAARISALPLPIPPQKTSRPHFGAASECSVCRHSLLFQRTNAQLICERLLRHTILGQGIDVLTAGGVAYAAGPGI